MTRHLVPLLVVLLLAAGCGGSPDRAREPAPAVPAGSAVQLVPEDEADLELWVSNQSFTDDPVAVTITIDGVPVVDEDLEVGNQHNWQLFPVALDPGRHTLRADSATGVTLRRTFVVPQGRQRHAVVDYWNYEDAEGRSFSWHIQEQPIVFM